MPAEWWEEDDHTYLVFDLIDAGDDAVQSMALFVTNNQTSQLVLTRTVQSDSGVSTLFTDKEQP